jgi:hypothetical protein
MRTVFDLWTSYRAGVLPADAGPIQVEECRRAFYAGAAAVFGLTMGEACEPEDEQEIELNLHAIANELGDFTFDMRAPDETGHQ